MKKLAIVVLFSTYSFIAVSQVYKGQVEVSTLPAIGPSHYIPEYAIDVPSDPAAWNKVNHSLNIAFGAEDELFFRTEVPLSAAGNLSWSATGWRGERLNTQIIVWSADTLQQVRFKLTDLKSESGKLLSRDNIRLEKVCYVLANYPYGSPDAICGETPYKNGFLMPDRFESFGRFDVPGKTVRPVWLSCNIPADAAPGIYHGTITADAVNAHAVLNITIKVQSPVLPKPHDWNFRLDIWQNPWIIADYYHVKPWSEAHKALLKQHLKLYAEAGGTYITTYAVHSPWGDNEYAIEGGMINWLKRKDGSWHFDYSIFDEYVKLAMSVGIDKAITIYTPLPWGERFRYFDEAAGNYVYEQWLPKETNYTNNWNAFLTDLRAHLKTKGWFNKTFIGINENAMEQTLAAIKVIKQHSAEWKITYAGDWHPELDTLLNDYSFLAGKESGTQEVKARTQRGQTTSFYVCCNPAKPNNFLFSPPVEGRWISWYAAAHGYNGFLRWAYDSWPEDPLRDARYGSWAAGDCFLVYPGANSCIRFEKLREGIVDYEKINMLRRLATKSRDKEVKQIMSALDQHLSTLNEEHVFNEDKLKSDIAKGRQLIDELSERVSK